MRKITCALILTLCAAVVFAQDFTISGEMKTGLLQTTAETGLDDPYTHTTAGSKDDAGSGPGRFRINVDYFNQNINVGFKFRLNWEYWHLSDREPVPAWSYAFGYAKFFDRQVTMSFGKLGASPWGTGGPEKWKELEAIGTTAGIRFEAEPHAVPGLNVGLVLNGFNYGTDVWNSPKDPITLWHILQETVVGASYTHEWFHARAALRFDSVVDGLRGPGDGKQGAELVYRLEEKALQRFAPGLKLWAMGYIYGIAASKTNKENFTTWNWFFAEYEHPFFVTQIRFGYDAVPDLHILYIKPSFYFTLFDNLIKVGASFEYKKDFGNVADYIDSFYREIELRPLLQVNISSNIYAAFEYSFKREYVKYIGTDYQTLGLEPLLQTQWLNLRVGVTF